MNKLNLHIYFSPMLYESRIFKITQSLINNAVFNEIIIAGTRRHNLPIIEPLMKGVTIHRFGAVQRSEGGVYVALAFISYCLSVLIFAIKNKPMYLNVHSLTLMPIALLIKIFSWKVILIYDAHELETETNGSSSVFKFFKRIIESLGIRFFKHCFFVSPSILTWYKSRYGIESASVVMNCPKYWPIIKPTNWMIRRYCSCIRGYSQEVEV